MTLKIDKRKTGFVDRPSFFLMICCYIAFGVVTTAMASWSPIAAIIAAGFVITLHSSLQHEALHGHIVRSDFWRYMMAFPAMGLFVSYERFRDTHLAHHEDIHLTDPYDDPESNFLTPDDWKKQSQIMQAVLAFNNTLLGRMVLGPAIGLVRFYKGDAALMMKGDRQILKAYVMHGLGMMPVIWWIEVMSPLSMLGYVAAAYIGLGLLKIRTFLEHRAHEEAEGRTVIIEDRGLFAFLFLNNNFHALHHQDPSLKWYELPKAYLSHRDGILERNKGYQFTSYGEIFRKFLLKRKDPVAHPLR